MRLLDLFCGAGGCSVGYARAGFDVVGVDLHPQPNYPYEFARGDALRYLEVLRDGFPKWGDFDAIHASPPCQFASSATRVAGDPDSHANLIPETRRLLEATGLPYVIENVEGARSHLRNPILICGSMFDPPLDVRRHRYFETNWGLQDPQWPCRHGLWDFRYRSLDQRKRKGNNLRTVPVHGGGQLSRVVGVHGNVNYAGEAELRKAAMGISWMTQAELSQAIPPAYTELIGHQLAQYLATQPAATPGRCNHPARQTNKGAPRA